MIEIKSHFTDYRAVSADQARSYVKFLLKNMVNIPRESRIAYIEAHYLKGCTVHDLLC